MNTEPTAAGTLFSPPSCSRSFRAGDTVHHEPSGEEWTLANDEENGRVSPSGWPATMADAKDCRLIEPASEIDRIHALQAWAKKGLGYEHERDHRTRTARRQLSSENSKDRSSEGLGASTCSKSTMS